MNKDETQPKPFGYFLYDIRLDAWVQNRAADKGIPFYTHPKEWVWLTDEDVEQAKDDARRSQLCGFDKSKG